MAMQESFGLKHANRRAIPVGWVFHPGWWILPSVLGGIFLWYQIIAALLG